MSRIRRKSVFYKYLVSYFLIFLVPLIIMTAILYYNSVVNLQKEIESSNMSKLSQTSDMLDARFKELEQMASNISNDNTLIPYMMKNYSMKAKEGIEQLNRYKANSAFIDELLLYFRGDNTVFSPNGQSSLDTLVQRIYHFDALKERQLLEDMNSISTSTIRPVEKVNINSNENTEVITYLIPIQKNVSTPSATLLFFIKKDKFDRMIENTLGSFMGTVYILDQNNNVLVSINNGGFAPTKDMWEKTEKCDKSGVYRFNSEKKTYSVVKFKSENSGITFITLMPTDQFLKKVVEMRILIFEIALLLFVFGIGMAFTMSFNNYRPIRKLSEALKQQWLVEGEKPGRNEIEDIRSRVEYTIHQNQSMTAQIKSQIPLISDQLLTMLLKGNIQDRAEFDNLISAAKLSLAGPYYCVVVLSWKDKTDNKVSTETRDDFLKELRRHLNQSAKGCILELFQEGVIAFILNLSDENTAKSEQAEFAMKIQEFFSDYFETTVTLGIGKAYNEIVYVNRSYIEAMAALEYKFIRRSQKLLFFDEDIQLQNQEYWYPIEEQLRLVQSIKQGNLIVALENLRSMIKKITEKQTSFLMLRFVCFDIVNMVVKTIQEIDIKEFTEDIENIMRFESLEELEYNLESLLIKICDWSEHNKQNKNDELRKSIIKLISEHYYDSQLSLEYLSEKFGFSIYYLSRFFKEQIGDNFIDYVTDLRIKEAKKLLISTEKPIKDIVNEVGYIDVSSFMRKFKKLEGITPGKYRELYSRK